MAHPLSRSLRIGLAGAVVAATAITSMSVSTSQANAASQPTCDITLQSNNVVDQLRDVVNNQLGENQTLCLAPGTYRISDGIYPKDGQRIIGPRSAIVSGAVVLSSFTKTDSGWEVSGALPSLDNYPYAGLCEDESTNFCQMNENIFWNGRRLRRVAQIAQLDKNSWYADYTANRIVLGANPSGATIELSRAHRAFQQHSLNVTLEGFTIQRFANPGQQGAILVEGKNWLLKGLRMTQNHGPAITLANAKSSRITGCDIVANGQIGATIYKSTAIEMDHNRVLRNNTDGFWINDWESGGVKITWNEADVHDNVFAGNLGVGVWADAYAENVRIANNRILNNGADGVRYEISYSGAIINNILEGNGWSKGRATAPELMNGGGLTVHNSENVLVKGNVLRNNLHGIGLQYRQRSDDQGVPMLLLNVRVEDNYEDLTNGAQTGIVTVAGNWASFDPTKLRVSFSNNDYVLRSRADRQFVYGAERTAPTYNFQQWRSFGFDAGSKLTIEP